MVAISLMLIVVTLGYLTFNSVYSGYLQSENTYIAEEAARESALKVNELIGSSVRASIYSAKPAKLVAEEYCLYTDPSDKKLYLCSAADPTPRALKDTPLSITFSKAGENGTPLQPGQPTLKKALQFSITVPEVTTLRLETVVHFPNMIGSIDVNAPKGIDLTGNPNGPVTKGPVLVFSPAKDAAEIKVDPARCFIATAAYGDPNQRPVMLLRRFRDDILLQTPLGREVVDCYYRLSPPIAKVIAKSPALSAAVRLLLRPLEVFALFMLQPAFFLPLLWLLPLVGILWCLRRRHV